MKPCVKNIFLLPALIAGLGLMMSGRGTAQTFTTLHSFTAEVWNSSYTYSTNSDGGGPCAALVLSGNTLYGTASDLGWWEYGTIFRINTDGTGFTNLYNFTGGNDGGRITSGLIISGNTLFGTTPYGGTNGAGTVFAVNINGTGFTNVHNFSKLSGSNANYTNSEGAFPVARLILSGNTLGGAISFL